MERPNSGKKSKKMDFKRLKNNAFNSLNDVEMFLRDFKQFSKYINLKKEKYNFELYEKIGFNLFNSKRKLTKSQMWTM